MGESGIKIYSAQGRTRTDALESERPARIEAPAEACTVGPTRAFQETPEGLRIYSGKSRGLDGASVSQSPETLCWKHGISIYGRQKMNPERTVFLGREDIVVPSVEPETATPSAPMPKTGPHPKRSRTSAASDYGRALDETYGPGTYQRAQLARRAQGVAEEWARQNGNPWIQYDHVEVTTELSAGPVTVTLDPLKNSIQSISGAKGMEIEPGALDGAITIDTTTGKIQPSFGASIGAASLTLEPDGFRYGVGGIENKLDYQLNPMGGTLKPTVPLGPFTVTAEGDGLISVGYTYELAAGVLKAKTEAKVFFRVDGERVNQSILDGLDDFIFEEVNGVGLFGPLLKALDGK